MSHSSQYTLSTFLGAPGGGGELGVAAGCCSSSASDVVVVLVFSGERGGGRPRPTPFPCQPPCCYP